ncbi:MAG: class I SAM-dependent methyltransferase [Telmatospirillum sp.]|nr:class I SAM-dependent methyltransferase [Telmatospirillum sp.]
MAAVAKHYETLLAGHYTWMSGGFPGKVAEQTALLTRLGLAPRRSGHALDLGCGPGFQSVALADLGYDVTAFDINRRLLAELTQQREQRPIVVREADIRTFASSVSQDVELIVCMGDTLTHLPSRDDVERLFRDAARTLEPGGGFVLTYRDLSAELTGTDRFIPVRADSDRIMTCFLDYEAEAVVVHDLIHVRDNGEWTLHKSSYRKLRLPVHWVRDRMTGCGLILRHEETVKGMTILVGGRPDH